MPDPIPGKPKGFNQDAPGGSDPAKGITGSGFVKAATKVANFPQNAAKVAANAPKAVEGAANKGASNLRKKVKGLLGLRKGGVVQPGVKGKVSGLLKGK